MAEKRITLIANNFPPETGAAAQRLWNMVVVLKNAGYQLSVITVLPNYPKGKIFPEYRKSLFHKETVEGITIFRLRILPTHSSNPAKRGISMLSHIWALGTTGIFRLLRIRPHVVIVQTPSFANGIMATWLSRYFTKATVILNVSDLYPLTAKALGVLKHNGRYERLLQQEQLMYKRADAFIVQSEEIGTHIKQIIPVEKPFLLYRHLKNVQIEDSTDSQKQHHSKIIYAGLLGIAQDVLRICQEVNFSQLGTTLHIYGEGRQKEDIEQFIRLRPQHGIVYCGHQTEESMLTILPQYGAVLVPLSAYIPGAVPSKLYMASSMGLPVIFMGEGEGAAAVRLHQLGWVVAPGDFGELKQVIKQFANSKPDYLKQLAKNGIQLAAREWNKSKQDTLLTQYMAEIFSKRESKL